ncbi:uncharacterized protein [Anabrus simplex]|uniref:uncharacterized protein isoform X3 n=1 Tax=Anabrus simplex TaxID=316456 RepID=UPI0035A31738
MEVVPVPVSGGGAVQLPFQRRNVQEWSRLDRLTGMLEHARVETDQWAANTATSTRKYGKVVDSRARNLADGSVQQRQRKQLEVFQAQVPGGSFQVIRTQSVTSTSSSSNSVNWRGGAAAPGHNFDNLQLSGHPLDLAPQKNKANVGRSGSIRTRRPPSRPRSIISKLDSSISEEEKLPVDLDNENTQNVHSRLSQVSRICHQIHKATTKKAFDNSSSRFETPQRPFDEDLEIEVPTTRLHHFNDSSTDEDDENGVHIEEILDDHHSTSSLEKTSQKRSIALNGSIHKSVSRKKSSSTEDLQSISLDNRDKSGKNSRQELDWKRTSQIRRSLQFPLKVTQENIPQQRSSPVKLLQESNEGRTREVSALKGYEALESIFRRGANIAESVNKSMTYDRDDIDNIATDSLANHLRNENMSRQLSSKFGGEGLSRRESSNVSAPSSKRHSFVTVESLKEVRGRLRRLSSPPLDDVPMKNNLKGIVKDADEHDDGIVTEEFVKHSGSNESMEVSVPSSRVRSYVFGMEANTSNNSSNGRKPLPGTGSLESRTSSKSSGNGGSRSEEWYNRRKSYGFEPVHSHDSDEHSKSIKFREKNKVESSTDSGICQSSEAVTSSVWSKTSPSKNEENDYFQKQIMSDHAHNSENVLKISHNIQIKKTQGDNLEERQKILDSNEDRNDDTSLQKGRRTVVTLGKESNSHKSGFKTCDDGTIIVHNSIMKDDSLALKTFASGTGDSKLTQLISSPSNHRDKNVRSLSESVTITIPVVSEDKGDSSNVESKRLFFRQLSEGTSVSIESPQNKSVLLNGVLHKENSSPVSLLRSNSQAAFKRGTWNNEDNWPSSSKSIDSEMKRHSIAVAEPEYVREELKSSSARNENHKNQFEKEFANVSTSELVKRFAAMHSLKQEVSSHQPNKENGATIGINVSFIQNGEVLLNHDENSDDLLQQNGKKQKKVEFCKTEVHFAAESGRFNIVETDEKPPPSNMFRRRRRNSSANIISNPAVDSNKNTLPEVRFGDSPYEKKLLGGNENSDSVKTVSLESLNKNAPAVITKPEMTHSMILAMSKFQDDADKEDQTYTLSNATIVAAPHVETSPAKSFEDNLQYSGECKAEQLNNVPQAQNEPLPRSILKNNRKPRPFLLGENNNMSVDPGDKPTEEQDEKWGIRLRPVQSRGEQSTGPMWRSTVTLQNTIFDSSKSKQVTDKEESELSHCSNESELQKLVRSLRPTSQRNVGIEVATSGSSKSPKCSPVLSKKTNTENCMNGVQVKILATSPETRQTSLWSVADRIKQVEELKQSTPETKGYSTRINFGGGEATIIESVSSDDQQESSHKQPGQTASPVSHSSFQHRDRPKPIWLRREERKQTSVMAHGHPKLEANTDEPHQLSIASTVLPSYDQNRLRSVETLISTRSGQPKITSISLRYEGDQDVDSKFGDPLIKDSRKFRENGERQECYSFTDFKEEGRNLQSQRTENIDHITTSLTYASPIQISPSQGRISPSKEKSHSQSYVKDNYHKSKEKLSHLSSTSTYQKNKESSSGKQDRLCKGNSVLVKARVEENELHEKDSKNVHKNKENHHIGEKSYMNTIDRTTHVRETRSKSPADNDMLPSERRRNSSPSKVPSSQAATSVHYHDSNKERTPSPVTKSHHKAGSRVYGLSSEKSCSRNFKRMQNQDDHVSSEFSKETLGSKLMKGTNDATNRFSAQNIKDDQESTISDSEEVLTNSPLMIKSSSHQAENVSQKYDKEAKASRSRFVSRGRSVSPNKNPKISSSIKSRNLADHKVSRDSSESPIYENRSMFPEDADNKLSRQCRKDVTETDCTILEELTRAADQILQAVNGYTDDESTRASSEDDEQSGRYRRGRRSIQIKRSSASLGTISETPVHKQKEMPGSGKQPTDIQKTSSTVRRTQRLSKTRTGQNSSTSSVESFTKELRRSSTSLLKKEQSRGVEDRGKRRLTNSSTNAAMKAGSRTARLLQRASSREMLLQTHASSSEDIMSGAEVENNRKPRVPRRNRTGNININKTPSLASVTSSTKKTSSPSSSGQNISSPAATRLQRKDVNEVPRERHSTSATPRQRRSTGDQAKSHSNRARETRRSLLDEESHRRNSRREGTERKQCSGREGMEKMAGSSFTQQTPSRDKLDVNTSERRSVGNSAAVVKSSASHVVPKKKLSSSRSEGVVQNKSSK